MDALEALHALSPTQFEHVVARYLESRGYADVQVVGGAGDLGIDIRCKDELGRLVVAQCKRYKPGAKIGSPEIQTFFGMAAHAKAAAAFFVTTAEFTAPARALARQLDIELISGGRIAAYYRDTEPELRRQEEDRRRREEQWREEKRLHQEDLRRQEEERLRELRRQQEEAPRRAAEDARKQRNQDIAENVMVAAIWGVIILVVIVACNVANWIGV